MASLPPPPPPPPLPGDFASIPPPPPAAPSAAPSAAPEAAAQPQAASASDQGKQWDKPWSMNVVRQNAKQWSLAGDTALLLYLKEMSKDMISRTHTLGKEIDNLTASIKTCEVSTNNAFNDFITLANNQFVENRVYDEDVSQSGAAVDGNSSEEQNKKEKSKEDLEGELIPKISEAVKLGLNVLDTAYERLDVNIDDADSDDDEPYQGEPMMEIKDPYVLRSLPVLIGSEAFHQNDNVGLVDIPSEDEESDHGSISESEEEDAGKAEASDSSEYSYSDSDEETTQASNRRPVPTTQRPSTSPESSEEDDDMFGTSAKPPKQDVASSSESEIETGTAAPSAAAAPVDFASELAKKIAAPTSQGAEPDKPQKTKSAGSKASKSTTKQTGKSKKSKKPAFNDDDMFGAPESDEDDGLFSTGGGLFDSGGGLFDSTAQDDGGLFDDVDDMDVSHMKSKQKKKAVSSSEEDSEDEEVTQPKAKSAPAKQAPAKKPAAASDDLFGADSDEDDLFAASAAKPANTSAEVDNTEDDSLLKPKEQGRARTVSGRKVPAGAVSMFGAAAGGNPLAAALSKRRKSSSEEEEDDWGSSKSRENSVSKPAESSKPAEPSKPTKSQGGLFSSTDSDGEDDGLFSAPKAAKASPAPKKKMPAGAVSMFGGDSNPLAAALKKRAGSQLSTGNEEDEPTKLSDKKETRKPAAAAASGLFDGDDEEEGDLFGSKGNAVKSQPKKKPAGGVSLFGGADLFGKGQPSSNSDSLFDDESEEVPPPTTKKSAQPARAKKVPTKKDDPKQSATSQKSSKGLFSDSDDESGLFANKATASKPSAADSSKADKKTSAQNKPSASKGLFSDSDSGEDTAPTAVVPKVVAEPPAAQKPKKDLFDDSDDNDDMFSAPIKSAPIKSAPAKSTAAKPSAVKSAAPKQSASEGLFGDSDDDDDDIFAAKDSSSTAPKSAPSSKTAEKAKQATKSPLFDDSDEHIKPPPSAELTKPASAAVSTKPAAASTKPAAAVSTKPAAAVSTKPAAAVSTKPASNMFDDSDDDLFSGKSTAKTAAKDTESGSSATINTRQTKPTSDSPLAEDVSKVIKTSAKPAAGFFSDTSDDENMFNTAKTSASDPTKSAAAADTEDTTSNRETDSDVKPVEKIKPKRPAGAVSMFGGMDPTALLKKAKSPGVSPESKRAPKPNRKSVPSSSLFDSDSDDDLFSSKHSRKPPRRKRADSKSAPTENSDNTPVKMEDSSDPLQLPSSGTATKSPVSKLSAKLAINPVAMMPGAAPPKKEPTPQTVGFDIPAENSNVLHSLNKSRARVQQKRRPPSRHTRGKDSSQPTTPISTEVASPVADRVPAVNPLATTIDEKDSSSKASRKDPFFDDSEDDDFFSSKTVAASSAAEKKSSSSVLDSGPSKKPGPTQSDALDVNADSDSLFVPIKSQPVKGASAQNSDDDDIFSKPSSIHAKEKMNIDTTSNGLSNDTNNKSPSPLMEGPPPLDDYSSPDTSTKKTADPFTLGDSDDDIFSTKPSKSKQKAVVDIFDDDDLFSSKKPEKKKSVLDDLDDDDLFSSKPLKTKRQKAFRKDEDLFGDDDIFGDIAVKKKEKKSPAGGGVKKTVPSKKATIDDDMDDLFADLGTKKSKAKKIDLDDDDLFGDPLGGFK